MRQASVGFERVGKRIRLIRNERGISLVKMSELLDCSYKYLSDLEVGREKPSLEMIMKISNVLEKNIDYFLMDMPLASPEYIIQDVIAEKLQKCSAKTLRALEGIIDSLLIIQED